VSKFDESRLYNREDKSLDQETSVLVDMAVATNRTLVSKHRRTTAMSEHADPMKDVDNLHMYDSLLLNDSISKHKKNQSFHGSIK